MRLRDRATVLTIALAAAVVGPPAAAHGAPAGGPGREPLTLPAGGTVVSLTFDDGLKSQEVAAQVLADRGMAGTFYVNSSSIGYPANLTVEQLRGLAAAGHEIGGHGLDHESLPEVPLATARTQVCDDRATLAALGFDPRSFAYPYGATSPEVRRVVQECGYSSARASSGLYASPTECDSCPPAEDPAATDSWRIRTSGTDVAPELLRERVLQAERSGGGWVPLVFHHVCTCPEEGSAAISPHDFAAFVEWLAARGPATRVATVSEVAGGSPRPVVGTPLERLVPAADDARNRTVAFTVAGIGISQSNVIASGLLVAVAAMVAYRYGTRSKRYARRTG
ncbi:polysaccharide deacetylase family protein [Paenibacillus sp. TRM 82003]|uniref:polysaccharide deacetylase family protein n=1 Tax=Kineococcus sp. TRM81007 TaxID=2925831 RepID=UPI001F5A6848|nr:polysaccharide deacetylase family protein [Kineococcus sp. TRM81007]MCI2239948.1 polysaccharide deacetylase family protein [Kineococcus sp. TRM81007]MCI3925747.1 polysaccharide deacetylase family protein [Paenibacillus sp. TRM 82003]